MNLKYYLRGLGMGMLVTALIMGVSVKNHPNIMSESEIRAEAEKLGMVDGKSVLKENEVKNEEKVEQSVSANVIISTNQPLENDLAGEEHKDSDKKDTENTADENDDSENDDIESDETNLEENSGKTGAEDETEMNSENQTMETSPDDREEEKETTTARSVTITVNSGDGSQTVAKKLEDAGIVESALVYDKFLCQNGYEKKIRVGNFEISVDASYEEIAKILTGR